MKNPVSSTSSSQSGRGSHFGGELGCLDGAVAEGTTQPSKHQIKTQEPSQARRDSGEQPATRPAGMGTRPCPPMSHQLRRGALSLGSRNAFGRKQHKASRALEPGADRSLSHGTPSGATTHKGPAESMSCRPEEVELT